MMYTILKPVLSVQPSPLTDNMPALYGYVVILSGKDRMRTFHQVLSNVTNLSLDDQVELRIREFYTVSVLSLNSIGFSDAIKTYFGKVNCDHCYIPMIHVMYSLPSIFVFLYLYLSASFY